MGPGTTRPYRHWGPCFFTRAESVLVFGAFIDVPLIVGGFLLMYRFRGRISSEILKVKLLPLVLYLILSVPLIIFEEQIDCMPSWCGTVAIPPTLPFLFIEMLVLGGIVLWRHAKNALRITLVFSIYGVLFEIFLGGLVGAPLVIIALIGPYVAVGYAFISILPLTVLLKKEEIVEDRKEIAGTGRVVELQTQDSSRIPFHWPRRDLIASGIRCWGVER